MNLLSLPFVVIGAAVALFLGSFGVTSVVENKGRAALLSLVLFLLFVSIWFGGFSVFSPGEHILAGVVVPVAAFLLIFFMPIGRRKEQKVAAVTERVDERDVIFSRAG